MQMWCRTVSIRVHQFIQHLEKPTAQINDVIDYVSVFNVNEITPITPLMLF